MNKELKQKIEQFIEKWIQSDSHLGSKEEDQELRAEALLELQEIIEITCDEYNKQPWKWEIFFKGLLDE